MARDPRECARCGRQGFYQFLPLNPGQPRELTTWVCAVRDACVDRRKHKLRRRRARNG